MSRRCRSTCLLVSDSVHFDHEVNGRPAPIDIGWSYSITVQRT